MICQSLRQIEELFVEQNFHLNFDIFFKHVLLLINYLPEIGGTSGTSPSCFRFLDPEEDPAVEPDISFLQRKMKQK